MLDYLACWMIELETGGTWGAYIAEMALLTGHLIFGLFSFFVPFGIEKEHTCIALASEWGM